MLLYFRVESIDQLKERLNQLDTGLNDPKAFKELYSFSFAYAKPQSQRSLDVDTALAYWKILFKDQV